MELSGGEVAEGYQPLFTGFVRDLTERAQNDRRLQELRAGVAHVSRLTEIE